VVVLFGDESFMKSVKFPARRVTLDFESLMDAGALTKKAQTQTLANMHNCTTCTAVS
jgi:hypothetical protein